MIKKRLILLTLIPVFVIAVALILAGINYTNADYGSDFQTNGSILNKYNGTDSFVSVPEGITEISKDCFSNNPLIKSVELPESLIIIDNAAFSNCINLETVESNDSLISIGDSAFLDCGNLQNINFGKSLKKLGSGIFSGCNSLSDIKIDSENPYFICDDGVLYSIDKKHLYSYLPGRKSSSYVMPNEVEEISRYSFSGADNLKEVITGSALSCIDDYAFYNASALESITINTPVRSINLAAFENSPNLIQVIMPESVSNIYDSSFNNCNEGLTFICDSNSYAYQFALARNIKVSEDSVYTVEKSDESLAENLNENSNEKSINDSIDDNSSNDEFYTDSMDLNENLKIADSYYDAHGENLDLVNSPIVSDRAFLMLGDFTVNSGTNTDSVSENEVILTSLDDYAYYNNIDLKEFEFKDDFSNIQIIGKLAFARTGLKSIDIIEGVKTISYGAFYHCNNLTNVTIPSSVTRIDAYAFDHTPYLTNLLSDNEFVIVGDGILLKYNGSTKDVTIPEGVKYISSYAFDNDDNMESVNFPESLICIYEYAFNKCSNLNSLNSLDESCIISDNSFYECNGILN